MLTESQNSFTGIDLTIISKQRIIKHPTTPQTLREILMPETATTRKGIVTDITR